MRKTIAVVRGLVGLTGGLQVVLGIVFWTGHAMGLVQFHMITGVVFVLALWTMAALSARAGAPAGLVATTFVWGLLLAAFGMTQTQILPGPAHVVVRVVHLLTGVVAMALAGALQARAGATAKVGATPRVLVGPPPRRA